MDAGIQSPRVWKKIRKHKLLKTDRTSAGPARPQRPRGASAPSAGGQRSLHRRGVVALDLFEIQGGETQGLA